MPRPRGAKAHKPIATKVANEVHSIRENSETREVTTLEMVLLMLRNRALAGDVRCGRFILELERRYAPEETIPTGYLILSPPLSEKEYLARVEKNQRKYRTR